MEEKHLKAMFEYEINLLSNPVLNYEKSIERFRLLLIHHKEEIQDFKKIEDWVYLNDILKDLNKRIDNALNDPKNKI